MNILTNNHNIQMFLSSNTRL